MKCLFIYSNNKWVIYVLKKMRIRMLCWHIFYILLSRPIYLYITTKNNLNLINIFKQLLVLPYSKNASWTSHSWISKYSRCSFYHGFQLLYVLSCLWFISFGWACDNYSNTYVLVLYAHKVILMEPFNYTCAQSFLYKMMNICKYLD